MEPREPRAGHPDSTDGCNPSALGRLLRELSWEGRSVRRYRLGGLGHENVLTAEVLQCLDFLPRSWFLGPVVKEAHGATRVLQHLVAEIEDATVSLLPGSFPLIRSEPRHQTQMPVQPDAVIDSPTVHGIVETKRIRNGCFQREQLAREYVLALRKAAEDKPTRMPLLFVSRSPEPA